jgi:hypothetical protein
MVKPYSGFNTSLEVGKVSGKIQYYAGNDITSHRFDPNDLGYLETPNLVNYKAGVSYNQFTPTASFINYSYSLDVSAQYLYKPYRYSETEVDASANFVFNNFWESTLNINSYPTWQRDYFELRTPGKFLRRPPEITVGLSGVTDTRKRWYLTYEFRNSFRTVRDNTYFNYNVGFRYRFSDKLSMSTNLFHEIERNQRGYAFRRETNGEPVAGYRDYTVDQALLSALYNFQPRLNLTVRARHYWNKVNYRTFYNVANDGSFTLRPFITGSDENYNAFYLDAFVTWDFRLGSRITLGYKNWLGNPYAVEPTDYKNYLGNIRQTFDASHGNELTLKFIYFIDYNQLRK